MLSLHLDWLNHATHLHFPSDLPCSLQTHAFLNPECCPRIEGALLKSHSDVRTDFSTHCCTQERVNCERMLFLYICSVSCFMAWARASTLPEKGECLRPTRYVLCCTGMLSLQGQTGKTLSWTDTVCGYQSNPWLCRCSYVWKVFFFPLQLQLSNEMRVLSPFWWRALCACPFDFHVLPSLLPWIFSLMPTVCDSMWLLTYKRAFLLFPLCVTECLLLPLDLPHFAF